MGTTAQKLANIAAAKSGIKQVMSDRAFNIGDAPLSKYPDMVAAMAFSPLPSETKQIDGNSIIVSPNIKIYAVEIADHTKFHSVDPEDWPTQSANLIPLGYETWACGQHFVIYPKRTEMATGRSDTSGTTNPSTSLGQDMMYKHSPYQFSIYTNPADNLSNPDGTTANITKSGNILTLNDGHGFSWTCVAGLSNKNAFSTDAIGTEYDRTEAVYAQVEWLRHRAAKDTGIVATGIADKTYADSVSIFTDGNGDMYFRIHYNGNDIDTSVLAKYNIHSMFQSENPTQTVVDAIYTKHKANGVNMNDDTIGGTAPTKLILPEGSKGAEAFVYNGTWRIITPVLSRCSASTFNNDTNMFDAPAFYRLKMLQQSEDYYNGISLPSERMLMSICLNRNIYNSYRTLIGAANIDEFYSNVACWTAISNSANYSWSIYQGNGIMNTGVVYYRYQVISASAIVE